MFDLRDIDKEIERLENRAKFLRIERVKEEFRLDSLRSVSSAVDVILDQQPEAIYEDIDLLPLQESSVYTFGFPRGYGKTTFLVNRLRKNASKFYTIRVVPSYQSAERIVREEENINWSRCLVTTPEQNISRLCVRGPIGEILVDDYDMIDPEFVVRMIDFVLTNNRKIERTLGPKIIRVGTPKL